MGSGRGHFAFATAKRKAPFGGKGSATEPLSRSPAKGARGASGADRRGLGLPASTDPDLSTDAHRQTARRARVGEVKGKERKKGPRPPAERRHRRKRCRRDSTSSGHRRGKLHRQRWGADGRGLLCELVAAATGTGGPESGESEKVGARVSSV
jgi:hypothetical protein